MRSFFRKPCVILLVLVIVFASSYSVTAVDAKVFSDPVFVSPGAVAYVPVKIENNPGIMGFHLIVRYDDSVLKSPTVIKGAIIEHGIMDDNISVSESGTFDVIWSSTEDLKNNGILMTLVFQTVLTEAGETYVDLEYVQDDTFNEQWEDISFDCQSISIQFSSNNHDGMTEPISKRDVTDKDLIAAVEYAQANKGNPEEYLSKVNQVLNQLTGQDQLFDSVEQLDDKYQKSLVNQFVDEVTIALPQQKIQEIISDALKSVDAKSIKSIPKDQQGSFVKNVEESFGVLAPNINGISDKVAMEKALKALETLQEASDDTNQGMVHQKRSILLTATIVFGALFIALFIVVIIKHKNRQRRKHDD